LVFDTFFSLDMWLAVEHITIALAS
jgi:hypothetical protein